MDGKLRMKNEKIKNEELRMKIMRPGEWVEQTKFVHLTLLAQ